MNFKIYSFFLAFVVLASTACTPKTADKMIDKVEEKPMSFRSQAPNS